MTAEPVGQNSPPPNPLTVQTAERLVRKVLAEAVDLTGAISQAIYDPYDLLVDTQSGSRSASAYPNFPPAWYRQNQKRGEDLPYYYDENQLRFIRDRMRKLVAENPFAQCGIANYTNYAVGADGLKISAVSARKDCPPRLTERSQRVIDLFVEENEFGEYCKDRVAQGQINGDAPTRLFPDDDTGVLRVRPIESEHVRAPGGASYGPHQSFGVQTREDDVEDIEGLWVVEQPLSSPIPVFVPHDEVNWLKFNSPRSAKRGLPLFARGSCELLLRMALRLITATGSTGINRSKIGMVKYLDGVVRDAAQKLNAELANFTLTDPGSGQQRSVQEYADGAIITASANMKYEFPGSNFDAQVFDVAGKMILRAVAAYLNFPEFMLTADPSSGTFSNAFIAEAPSTRMFESFQKDFIRRVATNRSRSRRSIVWAQIVHAVKVGILAPETLHLVQIQAEGPSMVVRDTNAEANTNKTYVEMGVMSKKTVQLKIGLDPDQEDESVAKEQAKAQARRPAMVGGGQQPPTATAAPDGEDPFAGVPQENLSGGAAMGLSGSVQGVTEGFTGTIEDSLGRERHYVDGKPVKDRGEMKAHAKASGQNPQQINHPKKLEDNESHDLATKSHQGVAASLGGEPVQVVSHDPKAGLVKVKTNDGVKVVKAAAVQVEKPKAIGDGKPAAKNELADTLMGLANSSIGHSAGAVLSSAAVTAKALKGKKFAGRLKADDVATLMDEYKITSTRTVSGQARFEVSNEPAMRAVLAAATTGQYEGQTINSYTSLMDVAEKEVRKRRPATEGVVDASGHEHAADGKFGTGGTKKADDVKPKHGERAAALAKQHAEFKQARIDTFNAIKADAEESLTKATEHFTAAQDALGDLAFDSDSEEEQPFADLDAAISEHDDDDGTPSERYASLGGILNHAKTALQVVQQEALPDNPQREAWHKDAVAATREIAWANDGRKVPLTPKEIKGMVDAANEKLAASGNPHRIASNSKGVTLNTADDQLPKGITPDEIKKNKAALQQIIASVKSARQSLKAYVQHRREMKAIKEGSEIAVQESMDMGGHGDLIPVLEDASTWQEGKHPRDHGKFSTKEGDTTSDEDHPSAAGKAVGAVAAANHAIHDVGSKAFHALPKPVQVAVSAAISTAFAGWTASQKLAERISREKGATPEEAAKVRSILAAADMLAFKPVAIATAPLGGAVAAATWIVPPVTAVYLVHSTVRHPIATFRAAIGLVKDAVAGVRSTVAAHTQHMEAVEGQEGSLALAEALAQHKYDDWYSALLHAALQEVSEPERAVKVANELFEKQPQDKSTPSGDDADALFKDRDIGAATEAVEVHEMVRYEQSDGGGETAIAKVLAALTKIADREQPAPIINVNVPAPVVNVQVPPQPARDPDTIVVSSPERKPVKKIVHRDENGLITEIEEVES